MTHRSGRIIFGLVVGLLVATFSYRWITDPLPREERERQEEVVLRARQVLQERLAVGPLEIVDALAPNRRVGKVYVYPEGRGWAVSGYYRRAAGQRWQPYLMLLTEDHELTNLKIRDDAFAELANSDPTVTLLTNKDR